MEKDLYAWLWEEAYPAMLDTMVEEFHSGSYPEGQPWNVLDAEMVKQMWLEFSDTGDVTNRTGLETARALVLNNVLRLYVNTEVAGHTARRAEDVVEDYEIGDLDAFVSWAIDTPEGDWRISDYGLDKLLDIAVKLKHAATPGRMVMYIDHILHVTHMRSDLASWFIEGGRDTLNCLAES